MTITVGTTTTNAGTSSFNTMSHNSNTGANRLLIVDVAMRTGNAVISGVTYNGVSMTSLGVSSGSTPTVRIEKFWLESPATGANDVVVTLGSGSMIRNAIRATTYTSADASIEVGTAVTGNGSASTGSVSVSTAGTGSFVDFGGGWQGGNKDPFSPDADNTEIADFQSGANSTNGLSYTATYRSGTGGSDSVGTTANASGEYAVIAVEISEASGGSGPVNVTPAAISAATTAVNPTVEISGVTLSPSASTTVTATIAPTVQLGSITIAPTAASAAGAGVDPFVLQGSDIDLSPTAISATADAVNPTVVLGDITITPTPATAGQAGVDPSIVRGSVTVTPAIATSAATAVNPTVESGGDLTITPTVASAATTVTHSDVVAGSLTITPAVITAATGTTEPIVVLLGETAGLVALTAATRDYSLTARARNG